MRREDTGKLSKLFVAGIVLLIATVFVAGLYVPLGIAQGVLYVAPVALSLWLPGRRRYTTHFALACALLTALGIFLSPSGSSPLIFALVNRAYSLLAIGMVVFIDRLQRQLVQREKVLSTLEERQRLAREMHDGLAQLLGNMTAQATATSELLLQGRIEDAQHRLSRLQDVADEAYGEVRRSILGLRAPFLENRGFLETINKLVERINQQEGMSVRVEAPQGNDIRELAPAVEVQAIRIVQEALANVRKHSQAREALVKVDGNGHWLTITIRDDGQGFGPAGIHGTGSHLGLQIMRERVESVGGCLAIETTAGKGTSVAVRLPVNKEE